MAKDREAGSQPEPRAAAKRAARKQPKAKAEGKPEYQRSHVERTGRADEASTIMSTQR